jgi:hypothetical protein
MALKMKQTPKKLINYENDLVRGTILRCKGKPHYEDSVDFMIIELHQDTKLAYALLVASGYKAGLIYTILPEESIPSENEGHAISVDWLKANWKKWGYPDCPLHEVYLLENQ